MKTISTFFAAFFAFAALNAQTLTVHEWGTFTTLHGSSGGTLSGLYFEEEQLPSFVYHFPGFSPGVAYDAYTPCKDVTVKMETPILYFYSSVPKDVQVHVDFPMGAITQWFPNRSGGEPIPSAGNTIDFDLPERSGSIEWKAQVMASTNAADISQPGGSYKWTSPRQTDANLVRNEQGETEKFLFYRGLANFPLPLDVKFINDSEARITNVSPYNLPYLFVFDYTGSNPVIWNQLSLNSLESATVTMPATRPVFDLNRFAGALQSAGLTYKEAWALLNTWTDGYFGTYGFKVFWIVPREMTDNILPLSISPKPDTLERVLVAKTEMMKPSFEQSLLSYYKAHGNLDTMQNDRYHLAYMQRVQQLLSAGVKNPTSENTIRLIPNPATDKIILTGIGENSSVTITNVLGIKVMDLQNASSEIDIRNLPEGLYYVDIQNGTTQKILKLIKQ